MIASKIGVTLGLVWLLTGQFAAANESFNFIIQPIDTTAMEGEEVVCECQAMGTFDLPFWLINGQLFSSLDIPDGYRSDHVGLHFPAYAAFNQSTYQCLYMQIENGTQIIQKSTVGRVTVTRGNGDFPDSPLETCQPTIFRVNTTITKQNAQLSSLSVLWNQYTESGDCFTANFTKCPNVNYDVQVGTCFDGELVTYRNFSDISGTEYTVSKGNLMNLPIFLRVCAIDCEFEKDWILLSNTTQETEIRTLQVGQPEIIPDLNKQFDDYNHMKVCISSPDPTQDVCCPANSLEGKSELVDGLNFIIQNNEFALNITEVQQEWNNWIFTVMCEVAINTTDCTFVQQDKCNDECTSGNMVTYSFKLVVNDDSPVTGPSSDPDGSAYLSGDTCILMLCLLMPLLSFFIMISR